MHGPGSPPRGRGKVDGPPAQVGRGRITPAQAGRSPYFLYGKKDYKDHPRIGGEKAELTAAVISAMGSPPRRRGKGYREFGIDISDRITPAQAGKSVAPRQKRSALWDHPRVGGEKGRAVLGPVLGPGSPPRGRGKVTRLYALADLEGITPAWAGKSCVLGLCFELFKDHPRVGGEKTIGLTGNAPVQGSPPRGRGKESGRVNIPARFGITPAWAGKRETKTWEIRRRKDHPRVGGEKALCPPPWLWLMGSPPRGRGKGLASHVPALVNRITPAWAGKRLKRSHRSGIFISGPIPFHSVLHRPAGSGGSRAGRDGSPAGQPQNTGPA